MKLNSKSPSWIKVLPVFIGVIVLAGLCLGLGWFWGNHEEIRYDPYQELKSHESNRHEFIVKSADVSVKMANRAVQALKQKKIDEAIEDCKIAIDIFPIDAKPYILLTKLYLMTGQEQKMYDTLFLAGASYPNFDNIIDIIDDENLDKMPLDEPPEQVYLADFPEAKDTAVTFMFDDGEANVYPALATFDKYGYKATIPVVAGFVADTSKDHFWGSWSQWKDAADRGFEIANHSMYHRNAKNMHGDEFNISIDQAKGLIEAHTGHKVTAYVFPHDSYTDEAVARALRQHEVIRTREFLRIFYERSVEIVIGGPYVSVQTANRLVDIAAKRRLWLIYKCHGVSARRSARSFKSITPDFLDQHLAYIHGQQDTVWVEPFSHFF